MLNISENAAKRVMFLTDKDDSPDAMLRVTIEGGGCSGFRYDFSIDATKNDDDILIESDGAKVVVDEISMGFINNATLDFVNELGGSFFSVKNPDATASCGCGSSFAV